jgi:hypothetical protein
MTENTKLQSLSSRPLVDPGMQELVAATLAAGMIAGARQRITAVQAVATMWEVLDALNASESTSKAPEE